MATDDKELEQRVRNILADAVRDGRSYTQRELREELECDMIALNTVMKRIVVDRFTKSLVVDGEMPAWLEKLLKQIGRGLLKAIDERSQEDLAQRRIVVDDAMLAVQDKISEYDIRQRQAAGQIDRLERQLETANARVGEERGRRAEVEKREKLAQAENKRLVKVIEKLSAVGAKRSTATRRALSVKPAPQEEATIKLVEVSAAVTDVAEDAATLDETGGQVEATTDDAAVVDTQSEAVKAAQTPKQAKKPAGSKPKVTTNAKGKKNK